MKIDKLYSIFFALVISAKQILAEVPPTLDGEHFRVTVVLDDGFVDIKEDTSENNKTLKITGYCIDIFKSIASHANFTFELLPPSGMGSLCDGQNSNNETFEKARAYSSVYHEKFLCGQSDVQDEILKNTTYGTDFYLSAFYITPSRRLKNKFTTPYAPPGEAGLQLFGTATGIRDIKHLIKLQRENKQGPVCLKRNAAYAEFVKRNFPDLNVLEADFGTTEKMYEILNKGPCDILLSSKPTFTRAIKSLQNNNRCKAKGKPIGLIGDALDYGFTQYGIGVRQDMPQNVIDTIDYWMNDRMATSCDPMNKTCDNFASLYNKIAAEGYECGYVQFPTKKEEEGLSNGAIFGITIGSVFFILILALIMFFAIRRVAQRRRVKKRFVQQLARNIYITSSPDDIPAEKLSQLFQHISQEQDIMTKDDFMLWISDIKLPFLSEADYTYLWKLIDTKGVGFVTPIDFLLFLRTCDQEFALVRKTLDSMEKSELRKFTCRNLDRLREDGSAAIRKVEYKLNAGRG